MVKAGGDQDEIIEEFSQIKQRDMDKDGKLKVVGKDEVKEAMAAHRIPATPSSCGCTSSY